MTGKKNTPAYIAQKKCQHSFTNRYLFQLRKISDKFPQQVATMVTTTTKTEYHVFRISAEHDLPPRSWL